jgi:hypothetical protein
MLDVSTRRDDGFDLVEQDITKKVAVASKPTAIHLRALILLLPSACGWRLMHGRVVLSIACAPSRYT